MNNNDTNNNNNLNEIKQNTDMEIESTLTLKLPHKWEYFIKDLLILCCEYCDWKTLFCLAQVSRYYRKIAKDPRSWKCIILEIKSVEQHSKLACFDTIHSHSLLLHKNLFIQRCFPFAIVLDLIPSTICSK